ncbi:MAG TPA: hypothetical protein QGF66_00015 [SAR86 cluster bacterium]|jgi:hypothetical protein|nr:hypothetical protein [SAR86 cluster bacterium]|tara:strand:+ start:4732 stop:4995 length:264 start_codon:yes stop_codon:yes gene_type:complete
MKELFLILGMLIFGFYALSYIVMWMVVLIGSIFSENIYSNIQGFMSTLTGEDVVGFLVLTQVTIVPILSGWLSIFLYKKYKNLSVNN